eukprot:CAMPEP_0176361096 /NCGR_PEP_ID=MMETSP0126-20121128/17499_1 /TAXON_ID=141414 ORGANISM="Strombidinopsis acuminatum, Strain SPMC142" /NCGR_SAMPLE_ID=MMETSP0126 /ASSEMBLY_ACC=CAM_ASM_000229 /LENGTH=65 /DNA_ID=CAMNT_0017716497 /DNA_START=46 /DNA_END=240 /DNA_ORIENTATION=+
MGITVVKGEKPELTEEQRNTIKEACKPELEDGEKPERDGEKPEHDGERSKPEDSTELARDSGVRA